MNFKVFYKTRAHSALINGRTTQMKRIICLALVLISIFTLTACSREKGKAPAGSKNAASNIADFYLYVPKDWTVNTRENDLMASARVSDSDSSNITMVGFADGGNEYDSIDSYWDYNKSGIERMFDTVTDEESGETKSSFTLITDGEEIIIDKNGAKKYEYSGTLEGVDFSYMQVIIKKENVFYTLTFTSTPELYAKHKDTVNAIIDYIEFK